MAGKWPHSPMTTIDSWRHGNINGSLLQGPPPFRQPGLPSYPLGNGTFPSVTQTQGLNRLSDNIAPDTPGPAGLPDNPLTWAQPLFDQGEQPPKNENPREGVNRNTFQLFPTQRIVRIIQPPGGRKPQPPGGGGGDGAADTYMVMVTGNDSMPGYLLSKITSDDNSVTIAETGDGGGEAVDLSADELPSGIIVMWSGALGDVPDGWALCDGTGGTPDLQDKFVVGHGPAYHTTMGDTGGSREVDLSHKHTVATSGWSIECIDGTGASKYPADSKDYETSLLTWTGVGDTDVIDEVPDSSDVVTNEPEYYVVAFIMKL